MICTRASWRLTEFVPLVLAVTTSLAACSSSTAIPDSGEQAPSKLAPGAACDAGSGCASGICLQNCCELPCNSAPGHPECSSCDGSGACVYPSAICQPAACEPVTLVATAAAVCANGSCPTPSVQRCTSSCTGDHCGEGCRGDQDCVAGFRCAFADDGGAPTTAALGTCVLQAPGGATCAADDECQSVVCFRGVCCNSVCTTDPAHPECTYCDATGTCAYPSAACGQDTCDPDTNVHLSARSCSQGLCEPAQTLACGSYPCTAGQPAPCGSACIADLDCAPGAYCVPALSDAGSRCCGLISNNSNLYVDIATGDDHPCCGETPQDPCQTAAQAIAVAQLSAAKGAAVGFAPLVNYTLNLTYNGDGGDYQSPPPGVTGSPDVNLPCGASLHAPGIRLRYLGYKASLGYSPGSTFQYPDFDATDGGCGPVTYEGAPGQPLIVGLSPRNEVSGAAEIHGGGTFNLSNVIFYGGANLWGSPSPGRPTTFNLGVDAQGRQGGRVQFGWDEADGLPNGLNRIAAGGGLTVGRSNDQAVGPGSSYFLGGPVAVFDEGGPADSILRVVNQQNIGLFVGRDVQLALTHRPQIVGGRLDGGYGGRYGIVSAGHLLLSGATIANQAITGLMVANADATLDGCTISDNGCIGVDVTDEWKQSFVCTWLGSGQGGTDYQYDSSRGIEYDPPGGTLRAANSTFTRNFIGVLQDNGLSAGEEGQSIDLSSELDGGPGQNVISCNGASHAAANPVGACPAYDVFGPGADLWNGSSNPVNAANVIFSAPIRIWTCAANEDPASCASDAGVYKMGEAAIVRSLDPATGDAGLINLTNASYAALTCP